MLLRTTLRCIVVIFTLLSLGTDAQLFAQKDADFLQKQREKLQAEKAERDRDIQPLESAVDPDTYIIGPGDLLTISIWGEISQSYQVHVTPEGYVLIPFVRPQYVANLTLTDAKAAIKKAMRENYKTNEVTATLTEVRKFKVGVSGAVEDPGTYVVASGERVSDAIAAAGGFEKPEVVLIDEEPLKPRGGIEIENYPATRNIILTHLNGDVEICDIQAYFNSGDKTKNPMLLNGDVIYVPRIMENIGVVTVLGNVNNPGIFDYAPGDNLLRLVAIAGGFTLNADSTNIEIVRFLPGGKLTESISLNIAVGNPVKNVNFDLRPDDMIFVRSKIDYHEKAFVEIKGEVVSPGNYFIFENVTTLTEVIKKAGGFSPEASLVNATLVRRQGKGLVDREFARLARMTSEEMSSVEYEYFKAKSRQHFGATSVDFVTLFNGGSSTWDPVLVNMDIISIPKKTQTVNMIGSVLHPGLMDYTLDKNAWFYIEKAGGFGWNADKGKVRVIRANTSEQIKVNKSDLIFLGDTIFIPEKSDRNYWKLTLETMAVVAQLATVIIVVQSVGAK